MTALSKPRLVQQLGAPNTIPARITALVKGSTTLQQGGLVALSSAGYAVPGSTSATLTAAGVLLTKSVTNSGADGAASVTVERGVFKFANSAAGDAIAQTDLLKTVYIVDDQTVAKTDATGSRSAAGKVIRVDTDGVFVQVGF